MDRKTIVIGLAALAVVTATWLVRESGSRRIAANEVELFSPKLRRHDDSNRRSPPAPFAQVRPVPPASRQEPPTPATDSLATSSPLAAAPAPALDVAATTPSSPAEATVAATVAATGQADSRTPLVPSADSIPSVTAPPVATETNDGVANAPEPVLVATRESERIASADVEWSLPALTPRAAETPVLPAPPALPSQLATSSLSTQAADRSPAPLEPGGAPAVAWDSEPAASLGESLWPRAPQPQPPPAVELAAPNAVVPVPVTAPLALQPARQTVADLPAADRAMPVDPISTEPPSTRQPLESNDSGDAATLSAAVLQRAAAHLDYGSSLARRGSLFSARAEFQNGLKLIVESLDALDAQHVHATHFDRALRAIKEAEDFVPRDDHATILLPLAEIVRAHQSQLLTAEQCQGLTPLKAMQVYYSYASSQLATACGHVPLASELLHALGKLHTLMARDDLAHPSVPRAISLVMYQAALAVDPRNHKSANELGVAYARLGYPQAAKSALLQSLAVMPTVQAWDNLAYVHRQLGEAGLAIKAEREREKLVASQLPQEESPEVSPIRWVSPEEFSYPSTSPADYEAQSVAGNSQIPATDSATSGAPSARVAAPAKKPLWDQVKGAFRAR